MGRKMVHGFTFVLKFSSSRLVNENTVVERGSDIFHMGDPTGLWTEVWTGTDCNYST